MIESIVADGIILAYLVRGGPAPDKTTFLTPDACTLQVGHVVYPGGGEVPRHVHLPIERHIVGTAEVLIVQQGRCEVDIYTTDHKLVETRELRTGDLIIAVGGGHGFRAIEDLVLLEIKQGPFSGDAAKERF